MRAALVALLILLAPAAVRAETLGGRVIDREGKAVSVLVFAADAASDAIVTMGRTDGDGRFALQVPPRKHYVGLFGARWRILGAARTGPDSLDVTVGPSEASVIDDRPATLGVNLEREARILKGRIADETHAPLPEVAVEARLPDGRVAARAFSGADGLYALPLLPGRYDLTARAVGLRLGKAVRHEQAIDLVMSIATEAQTIRVFEGHVLTFRLSDSIDPEYTPPAPVKAWLSFAYGIEISSNPLKASQKRTTQKYWWLDLLRHAPRNPAALAGSATRDPLREVPLPIDGPLPPTGPLRRDPGAIEP